VAPLLVPADFRPDGNVAEPVIGFTLTQAQANDPDLTASIARLTRRLEDLTGDRFVQSVGEVVELDVMVDSDSLYLPYRTTAVSTVKTRDAQGVLTTQSASAYRLNTSLDSTGSRRLGTWDSLDLVPYGSGLAATYSSWYWPRGTQTVQVTGTFGWTVAPPDIVRALAQLCWDHYMTKRGDLGRASSVNMAGETLTFFRAGENPYNARVASVGIPEVDQVVAEYARDPWVLIA